jgi:hypothetical protein
MKLANLKKLLLTSIATSLPIGALALLAGVEPTESLFVSCVIAAQMFFGFLFWLVLSGKSSVTIPELIGVGISFGSLLSLLSVYVFRTSAFRDISWLFPGAILIFLMCHPSVRRKFLSCEIQKTEARDLSFLYSSAIFALSLFWIWALPLVIVPFAFNAYRSRRAQLTIASLSVAAVIGSQVLKSNSNSWWIFSHDQMYLEGFSEAIYRYGPNDNMHLVGHGFPYHWFSLLWSAVITHAANLSPLIALGKILPIVAILTCINLLWLIARQHSKLAGYIAVSSFVIGSNAINWTAIRFTASPTFLFSLIWLLAFAYVFQLALSSKRFGLDVALALLLIGAFGGKVTHGIIILGGLGLVLVLETVRHRRFSGYLRLLQIYGVLSLATIFVYLLVYRGQSIGGRMLSFSPGELGFQVGVAYMSSSKWIWMAATIAVLVGCSSLFIISLHKASQSESDRVLNVFCIGSFMVSLPLTFFLAQDGGSQGYFLLSASVIILIPASKVIAELITSTNRPRLSIGTALTLLFCAFFCYTAVRFWDSTPAGIDLYRFGLIIKVSVFVIPAVVFVVVRTFVKGERQNHGLILLFVVFLLFGLFHRTSAIETYFKNFSESTHIEPISGSRDRVVALTWLRNNSEENDIIATNRYCIPYIEPCIKRWYLVSAISRRRVLAEGFGYGFPVGDGNTVATERSLNSSEFGRKPNQHLWEYLTSSNVRWFVVDAAAGRVTDSWKPFATVVFQNSEMKILKLADHL